ncbi:CHASE2 domain-containing protein [Castellaniella hirudinis]|uniref:CHASE2 domain-containing protein n=1 Tax=Castellaniella hirudinis TaxID=1144617 RepID=A0ABV8RXU1_9BURK
MWRRKTLFSGLAVVLLALTFLLLAQWRALDPLDRQLGDALLRWDARHRLPPDDIVLIDIDQGSLNDDRMLALAGAWAWPRAVHAELITALARRGPRAIVVDLILSPPDRLEPYNDEALAQAMDFERAFVPMILMPDAGQPPPLALAPPIMGIRRMAQADPDARYGIDAPTALPPERWRTGYINFVADTDGIGRRIELGREVRGWWIPHMVGRVAEALQLPQPRTSAFRLHWYGRDFQRIPYAQVYLASQTEGASLPFDPEGKIIVIGATASGLLDFLATPQGATTPGPYVLQTGLANLQDRSWLRDAPGWISPWLAAGLIVGCAFLFWRRVSPVWIVTGFLGVALLLLAVAAGALRTNWYWMPLSVLAMTALALLAFGLLSARLELAHRHRVQAMFARFVDARVVDHLVASHQGVAASDTVEREVTVLFSDIRGFTHLSEYRAPEDVVALLNRYFETQVGAIFRHQGTLDKFMGDGIMAFWGAPIPQANHAGLAVAAALDMLQALRGFVAQLKGEGVEIALEIGIGIHTGPAVVGFLGMRQRLDYTAIGDTVNLASRIEGTTKGVARILVSEATRRQCAADFEFTDHGCFKIRGREQEVHLFEPVPRTGSEG